jgi:ABC-2 type transport system ATP-binding protein
VEDVLVGHLSKGYRQRVGLADALVGAPPILILDEPTAGLDPNQIRDVRALIRKLGKDHTILLSTHILSEVEATCTRALVIARGRLVAEGSIDEIRALRRGGGVRVVVRGDAAIASGAVAKVEGVAKVTHEAGEAGAAVALSIDLVKGADAGRATEAVVGALVAAGVGVREVAPRMASLEQVFSELTTAPTGDPAEGDAG